MTEFEKIIEAIKDFGFPYEPDVYTGEAEKYFVYNYADERGIVFADDSPEVVKADMQIHFFLPEDENFIKIKNQIRDALFKQGFTYPEITVRKDGKKRHIIFECEIEEEMEE